MVELSRVFRQSDQEFVRLLGEVRGQTVPFNCGALCS